MVTPRDTAESLKSLIGTMKRTFRSGNMKYGTVTYIYPDEQYATVVVDGVERYIRISGMSEYVQVDDILGMWQPGTSGRPIEALTWVGTTYGGTGRPVTYSSPHSYMHQLFGEDEVPTLTPTAYKIMALDSSARYPKSTLINLLYNTGSTYAPGSGVIYPGVSEYAARVDHAHDKVASPEVVSINYVIDEGGNPITTGEKNDVIVEVEGDIQSVTMVASPSGSIIVDIWKSSYADFPPTDSDSICASSPPTISSGVKSIDSDLSGWVTHINAGDILRFNVDSCATIVKCTISLKIQKS